MEMPSYGERTASTSLAAVRRGEQVVHALLRGAAVPAQGGDLVELRSGRTATTSCFLSMYGCRTFIAPSKKYLVLLSSWRAGEQLDVERALLAPSSRPSFSTM